MPRGPSSLYSPMVLERWWMRVPAALRRYSPLLSTAWVDGIYLTAWPRSAMLLSVASTVLGLIAGASHWSLWTIDATGSNSPPAIAFAQMLPLLIIAVAVGSVSANAGTMLVLGYAFGDFLIAGPQLQVRTSAPLADVFYLRIPQLISYVFFFMLAAVPILVTNTLLAGFNRRVKGADIPAVVVRSGAAALVQAGLVYGWTLGAVMVIRIFWAWTRQNPPLSERYYLQATDPWLPAIAAAAVLVRAWLSFKARHHEESETLTRKMRLALQEAEQRPALPRRLPAWGRIGATAVLMTLLASGFIDSLFLGAAVLLVFASILWGRRFILPKLGRWRRWTDVVAKVPLLFRFVAVIFGGYLITRLVLALPGQSAAINGVPGKFGAEIVSLMLGLLLGAALLPQPSSGAAPVATIAQAGGKGTRPPSWRPQTQIILVFTLVLLAGSKAYADICLDPVCCFGSDQWAALAVIGILFLLVMAIGWEAFAAAAAVDAVGAAVAGAGEAAAAAGGAAAEAGAAAAAEAVAGSEVAAATGVVGEGTAGVGAAGVATDVAATGAGEAGAVEGGAAAEAAEGGSQVAAEGNEAAEAAAGDQPTVPGSGGESPQVPDVEGETPKEPGGADESPKEPANQPEESPQVPDSEGEAPEEPGGADESTKEPEVTHNPEANPDRSSENLDQDAWGEGEYGDDVSIEEGGTRTDIKPSWEEGGSEPPPTGNEPAKPVQPDVPPPAAPEPEAPTPGPPEAPAPGPKDTK